MRTTSEYCQESARSKLSGINPVAHHHASHGPPPPFRFAEQGRKGPRPILPREAGEGDRAPARWRGRSAVGDYPDGPEAPSTMLRMVPLPRSASRNGGGKGRALSSPAKRGRGTARQRGGGGGRRLGIILMGRRPPPRSEPG